MTAESELSGVDLARQALTAAREAAKKNGATAKMPKRRTTTVVRRDGREPLGLGSAISRMLTERGMTAPAVGGSVLAHFDRILAAVAPELVGRVRAVGYDADTGRLDVVPGTPAAATKLRWTAPKLSAAANAQVPGANVRTVNVLAPAPAKAGLAVAAEMAPPTVPAGPAGRLPAPAGYHQALAATAPPTAPPARRRRLPTRRSGLLSSGRSASRPANPKRTSATAARPSRNSPPREPSSSGS
ncbi:DUF721 domain-containing protein [Streptomyces sp. NPDC008125]|uniref:DUF721 domain-containing protein n=1 Tax=Streptomyces sp. NPDC008125 TaxID=3364811 RepID=UPI0036E11F5F